MLKTLSKCVREYKRDSLLSPFFITLEVIMEVLIPFLTAKLIDYGIVPGNMGYILKLGGILTVVALLSLCFGVLSGRYASRASTGFAKNLRHDMFHNIQSFSFSNVDKFSTSSLVTRLTTDITHLQNSYQMIIRIAVRSPIMLIFSLVMAFTLNARLALVFLGVLPILAIGLYFIMTNAHPSFERMFRRYDRLNNVVEENLHGIRVVKSFVREEFESDKFTEVANDIYDDSSKAERILSFNAPLMQFCMYTLMILISWWGAKFIVSETMTTGALMSFITYIMQLLMSLMSLSMIFVMLTISRASATRVSEVLNEKSNLLSPEDAVISVAHGGVLFEDVSFSYSNDEDRMSIKDLSFEIAPGETVGIIGSTGCGKSTLISLIPRLYDATHGTVSVGGIDVRNYDLDALRNQVSVVLQKNLLFSGTIKDNIRWGDPNATDEEITEVCKLACADEFIRTFPDGYDTRIEQGGTNVSGGQKQRLCIARALIKKPKILILDDSTSAVDTRTDAFIRKALRENLPETTKIIIAQRISSVMDADKILVLDDGELSAIGTHEELLKNNEIYHDMYTSQQKGGDE